MQPDNLVEVTVPMPSNAAVTKAEQALAAAQALAIATPAEYSAAATDLKSIKAKWREIDDTRKALKQPVDEAAARIQSFFKPPLDFLAKAEAIVKGKLIAFDNEQERLRREEQARLNAEAEKKRQEIAEREAKARAEEDRLRREAEEAAAAGRAEEAAKLAARADKQAVKAEILEDRGQSVVAPIAQREAPKVAGVSTRTEWDFEVIDTYQVNMKFLMVDEQKVRKLVKAMGKDAASVLGEGIRVFEKKVIAAGRA